MIYIVLASALILFPLNVIIYMWMDTDFQNGKLNVFFHNMKGIIEPYKLMMFMKKLLFRASFVFIFIGSYLMVRLLIW